MQRRRHVAIVGGGFSGVALATELLRTGDGQRVTLLESGPRLGRGVAYDTADPAHLLNTRAERMSLFGTDPAHFVRWDQARGRATEPKDFVARSVYGDYLEDTVHALASNADRGTFAAQPSTEVSDIACMPWCIDLVVCHALPLVLESCSGELRGANGDQRVMAGCGRPRWVHKNANDLRSPRLTRRQPPWGQLTGAAVATSHPDFHRRPRSFTRFTGHWMRSGRGLSPPVRSYTDHGAREVSMSLR